MSVIGLLAVITGRISKEVIYEVYAINWNTGKCPFLLIEKSNSLKNVQTYFRQIIYTNCKVNILIPCVMHKQHTSSAEYVSTAQEQL